MILEKRFKEKFITWLIEDKKFGIRSSKDILSRLKRVAPLVDFDTIPRSKAERNYIMDKAMDGLPFSLVTKSHLKRALNLYHEFQNFSEKNS